VSDTGPGFSEAIAQELFNQFHTTKPEGMGLGLAICRFLIQAHGGTINASSEPGHGAIFRFGIPAAIAHA
jgi:two-component system sensor kinase FixL